MFNTDGLNALREKHHETLTLMNRLEDTLSARFYRMDKSIECMMLATLTGEPMVLLGPPGTAKSRLIRAFCNVLGLVPADALHARSDLEKTVLDKKEAYFEYLLTQFTEPSELFGYYDLAKLFGEEKQFERDTSGMMQRAQVVFLDEVFNASSAILNALLTFMNERKFHDRGKLHAVPMRLLFGASNHTPRDDGLQAFYDRFLLRCRLDHVPATPEEISAMVGSAWGETHATPVGDGTDFAGLLEKVDSFRADVDAMTKANALSINPTDPIFSRFTDLTAELRRKELSQMSNRRMVKFSNALLAKCLLRATRSDTSARIEPADLGIILDFGLDQQDDSAVAKLRAHLE